MVSSSARAIVARSLRGAALIGTTACALTAAACSRGGSNAAPTPHTIVMHPTVDRVAFDAREKAIHRDPSLIRLDDLLATAQVSADPGSQAARGTVWEFAGSAEGWTTTEGAPAPAADGAIRWKAGPGAPGIMS